MIFDFPDQYFIWGWLAAFKSFRLHLKKQYDLIYTTSNPQSCHIAGLVLSSFGVKWIVDYRDGGSVWNKKIMTYSKKKIREKIEFYYQQYVMKNADYVLVQSDGLKNAFCKAFSVDFYKMKTIPNGYDEDDFLTNSHDFLFMKNENELHILHVGIWYLSRDEIIKIIEKLNTLHFSLQEMGKELVLHAVGTPIFNKEQQQNSICFQYRYHRSVVHQHLKPYLLAADCYLLSASMGWVVEGARGVLAGKLWEYLRGGKPILLFGPKDDAWQIINAAGVGFYLGELHSEECLVARRLLDLVKEVKAVSPRVSQHSWQSRAHTLQEVFLKILGDETVE